MATVVVYQVLAMVTIHAIYFGKFFYFSAQTKIEIFEIKSFKTEELFGRTIFGSMIFLFKCFIFNFQSVSPFPFLFTDFRILNSFSETFFIFLLYFFEVFPLFSFFFLFFFLCLSISFFVHFSDFTRCNIAEENYKKMLKNKKQKKSKDALQAIENTTKLLANFAKYG